MTHVAVWDGSCWLPSPSLGEGSVLCGSGFLAGAPAVGFPRLAQNVRELSDDERDGLRNLLRAVNARGPVKSRRKRVRRGRYGMDGRPALRLVRPPEDGEAVDGD